MVNGGAGLAVPDDGGFALVGNAHRADVGRLEARLGQRLFGGAQLGAPDLARVMLYPARLRIDLRQLQLGRCHDAALRVEDDGAGAGGALVQGEQIGCHGLSVIQRGSTKRAISACSLQPWRE